MPEEHTGPISLDSLRANQRQRLPDQIPFNQEPMRRAEPGEYAERLRTSPFAESKLLRRATDFLESGDFKGGVVAITGELARRDIGIEYLFREGEADQRGTRVDEDGQFVLNLPTDYSRLHPARQLYEVLHRYMSVVLQRGSLRDGPENLPYGREILEMDIAYAQVVERHAANASSKAERDNLQSAASHAELFARQNIREIFDPS